MVVLEPTFCGITGRTSTLYRAGALIVNSSNFRPHDPLDGLQLRTLGSVKRQGVLYLNLVLPDNSHRLIPADWTNLNDGGDTLRKAHGQDLLASSIKLMQARVVVDALLARIHSDHTTIKTKDDYATTQSMEDTPGKPHLPKLGGSERTDSTGSHDKGIPVDDQNNQYK